jgi:hypothetical protein
MGEARRRMMMGEKQAACEPLEVLQGAVFGFKAGLLERVAHALELAAGVSPGRSERPKDIRAWKFVCSVNLRRVQGALAELKNKMHALMLETRTDAWVATAAGIEALIKETWLEMQQGSEQAPPELDPDTALCLLMADEQDAQRAALLESLGEGYAAELLQRLHRMWLTADEATEAAMELRMSGLRRCAQLLEQEVRLELAVITWARCPSLLSGMILEDLAWMFQEMPEGLAQLVRGAEAGKGIDAGGEA